VRLFNVSKVGCFCDGVSHSLEKRHGEDVKVLTLTLRVAPFDSKLAGEMPDGVKPTLFKLNNGEPKDTLRRADFALGVERQQFHVFAAPDVSKATIMLDQVRVHGIYARSQKDRNGFDLVFRATFGPVGRDQLEFVQGWLLTQKFLSFEEAEPGMFDDSVEDDGDLSDQDEKARRPAPMFETTDDGEPVETPAASESGEAARVLPHRHRDRSSAVRAKQTSTRDGKKGRR
jgi:hypothetical protein